MDRIAAFAAVTLAMFLAAGPAFAGQLTAVPEPMSLSLLVGGIVAIAAVKRMRSN